MSYKNEQKYKERERESTHSFVWEKYKLNSRNDIKFIQNKIRKRWVKI